MDLLPAGYEISVRNRLGVKDTELPDSAINDIFIADVAEAYITSRVPNFASVVDTTDTLMLQNATILYICALLAPSMSRRVNIEVGTIDVKWKKDRVDWASVAQSCLADIEDRLSKVVTVEVVGILNYPLGFLANFQIGNE